MHHGDFTQHVLLTASPSTLLFDFVRNLIDEMVTEEEKRRLNLQNNIEEYKHKLASLCAELHVAPIKVCSMIHNVIAAMSYMMSFKKRHY